MACHLYVTCDRRNLTWEQLVKLLAAVGTDGCPALRTIQSGSSVAPRLKKENDEFILLEDASKILIE